MFPDGSEPRRRRAPAPVEGLSRGFASSGEGYRAMKLATRLAMAALLLAPVGAATALGGGGPQVVLAVPGVSDGAIARFTLRFDTAMVPLGDPRAAGPVTIDCPTEGTGRWVDQTTYVHTFASPLPGGVTCTFTLKDGLRSLSGYPVEGQRRFVVDSGGPVARAIFPSRWGGAIEEDQVFLVAANMPADRASVAAHAYCAVDGVGERIPVEVLRPELVPQLFTDMGTDQWQARSFLEESGLPQQLPADAAARREALATITALRCARPLPPGRDVALMWGAGIASTSGRAAGADQRFDFTVREPFSARFECSRVNPQAGCNPMRPARVRFTAPVSREQAAAARLRLADGREIAPTLSDADRLRQTLDSVEFKAPLPTDARAQLVLPGDIRDESGRPLSNQRRFPLDVRFDEAPPLVKFAAPFGILERSEGGVLPVTVRNVEASLSGARRDVRGERIRVTGSDGEIARWLRRIDAADDTRIDTVRHGERETSVNHTGDRPILIGTGEASSGFTLSPPRGGRDFEVVGIPLGEPGFYVVELASPRLGRALLGRTATRYVAAGALVTNMAVHFKWGRENSLIWVTALDTGRGVGSARVQITDSCTGQLLARGTTDASGRLAVPPGLPQPDAYGSCEGNGASHPLMVSARKADDFSFSLTDWGQGIRPFDFDLNFGWEQNQRIFHTIFDRTLLRQGETLHMKHILRRPVGAGFALSPALTGILRLTHRGSGTSFDVPLRIDANGTGETEWTAPQAAPMGDYDLQVVTPDNQTLWTNQSFRVDEYRLPTMRATVTGPDSPAIHARSVPLDLYLGYLSGGGAPGAGVQLRVGYFTGLSTPRGYENFTFGGRPLAEGTQPMNSDGEEESPTLPPMQTLPVTLDRQGAARTSVEVPQSIDQDASMLVEMDYEDANGQTMTASRRIPLYASAVRLGIRTDGWMMRGDDMRLKFVALDTNGQPIAHQRVRVALYSREILTARRRLIGGFYAYDNRVRTTRLNESCSATTDAQGLAECRMKPGVSGEVYAVATTEDPAGNVARAVRSVWLAGDDDWWFGGDNGDRMDVIPEKPEYASGETARFQVRMPFREATALVTVEREGVLSSFVTHLNGRDPVIEVPMSGDYAPDVYVSVMAVRGRVGGWSLWLSNLARSWNLPFFSRDGGQATATVDLAKPAYRLGMAHVRVGWEAHRLGVEVRTDHERYAPRDTATVDLHITNPDGSAAGTADVALVAVDEALLQLSPNESWDLLSAMMGDRPVSVLTSTAQTQVVGKRHYGRKAVEAGGGGGGDISAVNRENFQPLLLWKGHLNLDRNGRAQLQVPLSDALSSFRIVAIATRGTGMFGTGSATVRTGQDLSIYSGVPTLARFGDRYGAIFTLRNGSDRAMRVTASVELSPRVATGRDLTVTIPPGGAVPVAWNLTAPSREMALRWTVRARSADGRASDSISVSQDIVPDVPVETWASSIARVSDAGARFTIAAPAGALPGRGGVFVELTDALSPPLAGVRDYMRAYPYNCFEQRASRAVVSGDPSAWNQVAGELPAYLDDDGLLRYFPGTGSGSESLTAYILSITAEAGMPLSDGPRGRMIDAMKAVLDGRLRREEYGDVRLRRVAAFAALARNGAATATMVGQIGMTPADMPTSTLADYVAALGRVPGLANGAQLRAAAERVLRARLSYEGSRIDIADPGALPWWMMASGDEAAIKALLATLGRPGWDTDTPRMMLGIAARQQRGHWDTTVANAWGVVAARKFAERHPAQAIAGITTASLGTAEVTRAWPLEPARRGFTLPLPTTAAPLLLRQGAGQGPWALVRVRAAVPLTQAVAAGYRMTRSVEMVRAAHPGRWTRGDVVRVTITVDAEAERNWVVVNDPIPPGAQILGNQGGQSELLRDGENGGGVAPDYVEHARDAWRGYFGWVPRGQFTVSYTMRLNTAGLFRMPPSRVEAMYAPAIFAAVPRAPVTIAER